MTELTRFGADIVTVAELMGHASMETTRYTRPSADDIALVLPPAVLAGLVDLLVRR